MKTRRKLFFSRHAKSSALFTTILVHVIAFLVAISFVVYRVITKEEQVFVAKEVKRPKMKLKKLQVPIKMEKRKRATAKLRKRLVAKKSHVGPTDIQMPEVTGVIGGLGAMQGDGGLGANIGFSLPEIDFFGLKEKSEKVCFIVLAGPASTTAENRLSSPKSRMCFHTLRERLIDMVQALPEYALFNATFFQRGITTPFSTNMLLATEANKAKLVEWAEPVNPLHLEESYGPGEVYEHFWDRFHQLDWYKGEVMTNDIPPVYPKWLYRYNPGPHIMKHFLIGQHRHADREFIHWARAACFALEQKPDDIFVLTNNWLGEDTFLTLKMLSNITQDIYGKHSSKRPTINVVVLARHGNVQGAQNQLERFLPIVDAFRGQTELIEDIRDHMTAEEIKIFDDLEGIF